MDVKQYLTEWSECYRKDFVENIMPFWMKNGLDRKHGGVYTCLDRDGGLMDTTKSATHSSILSWRIPMDRGAWQTTVHGVAKSQTELSN